MSTEQPPLLMHRRGGMLVAHGPMDDELVRSFPANVPLRVRLTAPRNPRAMRYYFALLTLVKENLPEPAPTVNVLHEAVKVMLGYTLTVKTPRGDVVLPGSIAFDKMTEPEFRQYLEAFKTLVVTRIIPGIDMPQFEKAAREMLGAPLEPGQRRLAARGNPESPGPDESPERYDATEPDEDPFGAPEPDEDGEDDSPFGSDLDGADDDGPPETVVVVDDTIRDMAAHKARLTDPVMGARVPPPGLDERERAVWFDAYDVVKGGRPPIKGLAPGETVDGETGEVIAAPDPTETGGAPTAASAPTTLGSAMDASLGSEGETSGRRRRAGKSKAGEPSTEGEQGRGEPSGSGSTITPTGQTASPPTSFASPGPSEYLGGYDVALAVNWLALSTMYRAGLADGAYEALEPEGQRMFRQAVWERMEAIAEAGDTDAVPVPPQDYDAMWLWLEFGAKTVAEIDGLWPIFWRSQAYSRATDDQRSAIAGLLLRRQKELGR